MRTRLVLPVVLLLGLFLPSAVSGQSTNSVSLNIDSTYQEAAAGTQMAFIVSASSNEGGTVAISLEPGVVLAGDPICYGPCGGPYVAERADAAVIQLTLAEQVVTVGFMVKVSPQANVGNSIDINVMLIVGPDVVERTSATVLVLEPAATMALDTSALPDTRQSYMSVSPEAARMVPGGSVLYFIQPIFWGDWRNVYPTYSVDIKVPVGLSLFAQPYCGERTSSIPTQSPCDVKTRKNSDGSKTISTTPGFSSGATNGIYLTLSVDPTSKPDSSLRLSFTMVVPGATGMQRPGVVKSNVFVVNQESLVTPQQTTRVSGLIEKRSGYSETSSGCTANNGDGSDELDLYEWGNTTVLGRTYASMGTTGLATDGSEKKSCFLPFSFDKSTSYSVYTVASGADSGYGPCRSCVIGFITTSSRSDQIFVDQTQSPKP